MAELIDLLLLLILDILWILSIDIKIKYKRLERTCNYLRFSHWYVTYALLIMKRDTTWATWLFLVQAVRLKPNITNNIAINASSNYKYLIMSSE